MKIFSVEEIVKATGGKLLSGYQPELPVYEVCTDSRLAKPGDVFFPLIGENNDAHDFLGQVLEKGCMVLVVSEPEKVPKIQFLGQAGDPTIILVDDTTKALQRLSIYYLNTMPLKKKVAVTGSVGKTSTRDMLYYVASSKYCASKSIKNYNNAFGMPLSILDFKPDTEIAIIEMGMSVQGSIDFLAEMTRPNVAVITNIGISHIENFPEDGRYGILRTKLEVTNYFDENSTLILNCDNDLLDEFAQNAIAENKVNYKIVRVGSRPEFDYYIHDVNDFGDKGISFKLTSKGDTYEIKLDVPGAHNALNAGLAIAMGELSDIEIGISIAGLEHAKLTGGRLSIKEANGIKVIDDSYNAAPDSMVSGINTLMKTEGKRHIAMLGDMYELGFESENGHKRVGRYTAEMGVDVSLFMGDNAKYMLDGWLEWNKENGYSGKLEKVHDMPLIYVNTETNKQAEYFLNKEMVMENCREHLNEGDVVIVKASNGMRLGKIVEVILNE